MPTESRLHGPVAVITLNNPPVNGLDLASRRAMLAALNDAQADAAVTAVVLIGAGRMFCAGADIREFGTPQAMAAPNLHTLITAIESCTKPVVAAIHGTCMGGGLEVALGCHWRIVARGTAIALPEVKLGLLPGAGGTQRLPRVIGVPAALAMITSGRAMTSDELAALPGQRLIDDTFDGEPLAAALAFVARLSPAAVRPSVSAMPVPQVGAPAAIAEARQALPADPRAAQAAAACIACVEKAASGVPIAEGLAFERSAFVELLASPASLALRHAFFAERAAGRIDDLPPHTRPRPLRHTAVVGAGTMGRGITVSLLDAGLPVRLLETDAAALDRGVAAIGAIYEARLRKGRIDPRGVAERIARLLPTLSYADLADVDLAIEAVFEETAVKQSVLRRLDEVLKPGAILASNTSTLDLDQLAAGTSRPTDVVGLHFFSPAQVMRLLEVVRGRATAPDVLATALALARTMGKTAVVARVCDGFIGNRMIGAYLQQAGFLLDEGASPRRVDAVMEGFGFAMGPFRMSDLAGNDIGWAVRKRHRIERPEIRYSATADRLCELGRFGQKTGAGWYDYPSQTEAIESAVVAAMIEQCRRETGLPTRSITSGEIEQRLVYALVNEGARLLEGGIASRASDIDVVYLTGYGFPRWRGGPMFHADERGLAEVIAAMQRFAALPHADAAFWQPAAMLQRLAGEGKRFT
jgi:3-hydroxyacyl-CoA dehydrogenase